jgi:hypothetical protein
MYKKGNRNQRNSWLSSEQYLGSHLAVGTEYCFTLKLSWLLKGSVEVDRRKYELTVSRNNATMLTKPCFFPSWAQLLGK